jgi:Autoinducer binding domain
VNSQLKSFTKCVITRQGLDLGQRFQLPYLLWEVIVFLGGRGLSFYSKNICPNDHREELEKALNRVDFFRFFHALALQHHFEHFCILQTGGDRAGVSFVQQLILHDLPTGLAEDYDRRYKFGDCDFFKMLQVSTLPTLWRDVDDKSVPVNDLMRQLGFELGLCVPVQGSNGARFGVMLLGDRENPSTAELHQLHYDLSYAFDFFFQKVLSTRKGMVLTARETEILRWKWP